MNFIQFKAGREDYGAAGLTLVLLGVEFYVFRTRSGVWSFGLECGRRRWAKTVW